MNLIFLRTQPEFQGQQMAIDTYLMSKAQNDQSKIYVLTARSDQTIISEIITLILLSAISLSSRHAVLQYKKKNEECNDLQIA